MKAEQYDDEYLSLDLNVKVVADMDEAIAHIRETMAPSTPTPS